VPEQHAGSVSMPGSLQAPRGFLHLSACADLPEFFGSMSMSSTALFASIVC
jgi:hypothetical protein